MTQVVCTLAWETRLLMSQWELQRPPEHMCTHSAALTRKAQATMTRRIPQVTVQ